MYISDEAWRDAQGQWGKPGTCALDVDMQDAEWQVLRASMRDGRAHDVTMVIPKDRGVVVIRKPFHPKGVYRLPSGGVHPGEAVATGIVREAREETGLDVEPATYLLRVAATFRHDGDAVHWTSHVFVCRYLAGECDPQDRVEIAEARVMTIAQVQTTIRRRLVAHRFGGFKYRAHLQDATFCAWRGRGAPEVAW